LQGRKLQTYRVKVGKYFDYLRKDANEIKNLKNRVSLTAEEQKMIERYNSLGDNMTTIGAQYVPLAKKRNQLPDGQRLSEEEDLPEKHGKDLTDWVDGKGDLGLTKEELCEALCTIIENTAEWHRTETTVEPGQGGKHAPLKATRLSDIKALPIDWLWEPYLALGTFNLIEGERRAWEDIRRTSPAHLGCKWPRPSERSI